jgi:formamidopyrimidine-DNA glycosylase
MPELPDLTVYLEALERRVLGQPVEAVKVPSLFVVRTAVPPISAVVGRRVTGLRRLGKRLVLELEGGLFLVIHLMIAGRLKWGEPGAKGHGKLTLLALQFPQGVLFLTEASGKKRASVHLVEGEAGLAEHDRGGLEVLEADAAAFHQALVRERHTLKRTLTDPTLFSGIGNAYSDELLHRARLSPFKLSDALSAEEEARLFAATREVLTEWIARLRDEVGEGFPEKVTAFRKEMAVHGKYRQPCPDCGAPVQRIVHAENESNYCPVCQTEGRLLADRALSRLLKDDWPRTLEELEARKRTRRS